MPTRWAFMPSWVRIAAGLALAVSAVVAMSLTAAWLTYGDWWIGYELLAGLTSPRGKAYPAVALSISTIGYVLVPASVGLIVANALREAEESRRRRARRRIDEFGR